ncbi:Hypothetical_protein [Hexamita inflata]|uniref:Hypothetical_protein n=1 Tax=Hexamita inflata TaxID=28002 RepID=A0AA86P9M3_9EUKA|nr:Hypothetical protein HINF_LOCUS22262 [Hexamita inflata]CAI9934627.1 Hypothetical protein HINF_LOCUS22272 [Hexamita inflata]
MIITISFSTVLNASYTLNTGFITGIVSSETGIDALTCGAATYQILLNNSIVAKGSKTGLLNNSARYKFTYTGIDNAKQLFCYNNVLYYLTTSNVMMRENVMVLGKMTYIADQGTPANIREVAVCRNLMAVIAEDGLYVKGQCAQKVCIETDAIYSVYQKINMAPLAVQDVDHIEFNYNQTFLMLYFYLNNGDVFASGLNSIGLFPDAPLPDTSAFRRIGHNITNVMTGWNASRAEHSLYYILHGDMYVFNVNATPAQRLILKSVQYFNITTNAITYLQNGILGSFVESSTKVNAITYYCNYVPADPLCTKSVAGTFVFNTDCKDLDGRIRTDLEFCKVHDCQTRGNCPDLYCTDQNHTCKAIACTNAQATFFPFCMLNYRNSTTGYKLGAQPYKMHNGFVVLNTSVQKVQGGMKSGAAVGISIACCATVFVAVGALVIAKVLQSAKKLKQTLDLNATHETVESPKILAATQNL